MSGLDHSVGGEYDSIFTVLYWARGKNGIAKCICVFTFLRCCKLTVKVLNVKISRTEVCRYIAVYKTPGHYIGRISMN
jgi:hypothetical protein